MKEKSLLERLQYVIFQYYSGFYIPHHMYLGKYCINHLVFVCLYACASEEHILMVLSCVVCEMVVLACSFFEIIETFLNKEK